MKKILKIICLIFFLNLFAFTAYGEGKKIISSDHEWNIFSGMFDFSDDGKRSTLVGLQHQNENLKRKSFIGTISPITGFLVTADNALLSVNESLPIHVLRGADMMAAAMQEFHPNLKRGDAFLHNSP